MEDIKLDKRQIAAEALLLLREEGIEKLSMRKLAARLNIRAPTLYWYFPDRSSILREVIRTLQREAMARIPESATWQEWMRGLALSFWRNNCETPYVNLLLQSAELNDESVARVAIEAIEKARVRYGVDKQTIYRAHSDLQAFVIGWSVFYHSHVAERLEPTINAEEAVIEGVDSIIASWERRRLQAADSVA
jgi:TetR/AcrR family tetracycline transcriptional repressor